MTATAGILAPDILILIRNLHQNDNDQSIGNAVIREHGCEV